MCGTDDDGALDDIHESNIQNQYQTHVLLSSEEPDTALALGRMFESV